MRTTGTTLDGRRAILAVALAAPLADSRLDPRERQRLREMRERLARDSAAGGSADAGELEAAVRAIDDADARRFAFEAAVGACSADGLRGEAETRFLAHLGNSLGLTQPDIVARAAVADALATLPLQGSGPGGSESNAVDTVLGVATVCGALAHTGRPLAALAVIALQLRLVYRIERMHGIEIDVVQARERLRAGGTGLVSQYLEIVARQLLPADREGAVSDDAGGHPLAAARFAFASTWAVGDFARRCLAGGGSAHGHADADYAPAGGLDLFRQQADEVEKQAQRIDPSRLLQFVRNQC